MNNLFHITVKLSENYLVPEISRLIFYKLHFHAKCSTLSTDDDSRPPLLLAIYYSALVIFLACPPGMCYRSFQHHYFYHFFAVSGHVVSSTVSLLLLAVPRWPVNSTSWLVTRRRQTPPRSQLTVRRHSSAKSCYTGSSWLLPGDSSCPGEHSLHATWSTGLLSGSTYIDSSR